jgi:hypothetical protein
MVWARRLLGGNPERTKQGRTRESMTGWETGFNRTEMFGRIRRVLRFLLEILKCLAKKNDRSWMASGQIERRSRSDSKARFRTANKSLFTLHEMLIFEENIDMQYDLPLISCV